MVLIYRRDKKGPLSIEEIDGNFEDLDLRLEALEETDLKRENTIAVKQTADIVEFIGDHGESIGKISLPKVLPRFRGMWASTQAYLPFDWVSTKERGLYCCTVPHEAGFWEEDIQEKRWQEILPGEVQI